MKTIRSGRIFKDDIPRGLEDPVILLRNEHAAMLGQLRILERCSIPGEKASVVLRALIRDGAVHFRREMYLLRALEAKLGRKGQTLQQLQDEHRDLKRRAKELLKECTLLKSNLKARRSSSLRDCLRKFTKQFREHIQHEETVVYVLAHMRLKVKQRRQIASKLLTV